MEYININSDVLINCRHQKRVAKHAHYNYTDNSVFCACVFTSDVHLLLSSVVVIDTDEMGDEQNKNKTVRRSEKEVFKTYDYGSYFVR